MSIFFLRYPARVPRKRKLPWNHDLRIPGYGDTPPHVVGPPIRTVTVGHTIEPLAAPSTDPADWECLRCQELDQDEEPTVPDHSPRCPYRQHAEPEPTER